MDFWGEVKHCNGLDNVHIGTIRTILRLIGGIGLVLSPLTFCFGEIGSWWLHTKLTPSRTSMAYHEWHEVVFISVWRVSGCSHPGRELCCLDVKTGNTACTKEPILILKMQFSLLRFKLKEEPHVQDGDWRHANHRRVLKTCHFVLQLTYFLSSCGCFFTWFIMTIKRKTFAVLNMSWKTSLHRYTNQIVFLLLSLTELILPATNISTS